MLISLVMKKPRASPGRRARFINDFSLREVTQRLREAGYRIPIIALTAHAMSEVRKKCLDVGCTDFLPKPVNFADLASAVAKYTCGDS
ncbi:MAG: response regulator [Bdellovibrionaceae bacterium]|nr:response regulator [Bdellovibrio sp.]